jgi:hypothetical protein
MNLLRCRDVKLICSVAVSLLVLLATAIASHASEGRQLWQSRDQFVALDSQVSNRDSTTAPNNHPSEITQARLAAVLTSLEIRASDSSRIEPLFTRDSLDTLVPQLQLGLRQALPGEDVTFAVIGLYKTLYGFAKSPKVITGRMFVKAGQLNIIFGLVQQDVNEREDRRLSPFTPGTRSSVAAGDWKILPPAGQDVTLLRKDWVAFNEGWNPPIEPPATPAVKTVPLQNIPAQPAQPPAQPAKQRIEDTRSPADRLIILNGLKEKGLISDDEYRSKRMEILNGL